MNAQSLVLSFLWYIDQQRSDAYDFMNTLDLLKVDSGLLAWANTIIEKESARDDEQFRD